MAKIECKNISFFLKKNHPIFNYEEKLLSYLYQNQTNNLNIYAQNKSLNCFINENKGIQITDSISRYSFDIADKFINIQIKSNAIQLDRIGLRKFSKNEILDVCYKYQINSEQLLKYWGEIEKTIPLFLEHGDFHLGNILLDTNNNITFIDLAEGSITNPLFSLLAFENTLKWRGNLENKTIDQVKRYWINAYCKKSKLDLNVVNKMYLYSKAIFPLYCIFGLDYLLKTCSSEKYIEKTNFKILKYKELLNN